MGWVMTVIAAMTAFYMFRLYYGIFWGGTAPGQKSTSDGTSHVHTPHESPLTMTVPLIFLAAVTCVAGFIPFGHFISSNGESYTIHLETSVAVTSVVIAVASIVLATCMYLRQQQPLADKLAKRLPDCTVQPIIVSTSTRCISSSHTGLSSVVFLHRSPGSIATW